MNLQVGLPVVSAVVPCSGLAFLQDTDNATMLLGLFGSVFSDICAEQDPLPQLVHGWDRTKKYMFIPYWV